MLDLRNVCRRFYADRHRVRRKIAHKTGEFYRCIYCLLGSESEVNLKFFKHGPFSELCSLSSVPTSFALPSTNSTWNPCRCMWRNYRTAVSYRLRQEPLLCRTTVEELALRSAVESGVLTESTDLSSIPANIHRQSLS
jgi:hypothetical protein